ncbi:MAG: hypothetical protein K6G15_07735 [Desulfovibrio sp.]|nr:hypothetical protein [Desulfovibrio sp.]
MKELRKFTKAEEDFIDLCLAYPPDLGLIRKKLASEIDPNAYEETECNNGEIDKEFLIFKVIYTFGFVESDLENGVKVVGCRYLPDVIRLFLEAGFDPAQDEGRAGSYALGHFIFCATDRYLIPAAKLLLDAGADPRIAPTIDEPYEDALEMIRFDASVRGLDGDHHESKTLYELYEFMENYLLDKSLGTETYEFLRACQEHPVDFKWIKERLENGIDINASFRTHTPEGHPYTQFLIHEILNGFGWYQASVNDDEGFGCKDLPGLLELLFEHGLDLSLDEGRAGARALYMLATCKHDKHVLKAARILLGHGADPEIPLYGFDGKTYIQHLELQTHSRDSNSTGADRRFLNLLRVVKSGK